MATLINRECWIATGCLTHGKIIEHNLEHKHIKVLNLEMGGEHWHHADSIKLTRREAINECESNAQYWWDMKEKLEREQEESEAHIAKAEAREPDRDSENHTGAKGSE